MGLEPTYIRPCVCASPHSNMNISVTSWPIVIKFHLEHRWCGGLAALEFGPDLIRTLVSMAKDSSHRVIKSCDHSSFLFFDLFFFFLAGNKENNKISNGFEIWQNETRNLGVSCP